MRPILIASLAAACAAHEPARGTPAKRADATAPGLRLPDGVTPLGYELRLELDPDAEVFRGEVHIRVAIDAPVDHVWIHVDDLQITRAGFRDGDRSAALVASPVEGDQMRGFGFGAAIGDRTVTLDLAFSGRTTHDEEGLFRQRAGERWYLFSQSESVFARRITPCFDEPRWKTPWQVTLVVPHGLVALGNMPEVRATERGDGRREVELATTPPMPSYLLAVAVGPFELVDVGTVGRLHVPVRVAALRGDRGRVGVVAARLPGIVDAVEAYTDDALPWRKLDLVAVPHLFGAMENPGLVTFDAPILEDVTHDRFVRVAAHEIAHQWFGNLVTPAWWDDLWLSEAFASWLGDKVAASLGEFDDPALHLALARERALAADDEPDAKPLRRTIEHNDDPDNAYDAIAYDKGQAVLAMFESWIGAAAFRGALRGYLRDHRGGTATSADLVAALSAASSPAVGSAFAGYLAHAGAPVVELAVQCPTVVAHARDRSTVPVCVRAVDGGKPTCALVGDRAELVLDRSKPDHACGAVVGNDGGYYHVAWTSSHQAPSPAQLSTTEKLALADDLAAAFGRGELGVGDLVREVGRFAAASDVAAQHAAIAMAHAIDPLVDDATRPAWSKWLAARFGSQISASLGASGESRRELLDALVELVPADRLPAALVRRAARLVANQVAPEPTLVAIAAPEAGRPLFDRLAARATAHPDAFEALGELGPELADRVVGLVADGDSAIESAWPAVTGYFDRVATRSAAWSAVRTRLAPLLARMTGVQAAMVIDATAALCDPVARAEVAAAFEPRLHDILDGRRHLDRALAAIDRCIAHRGLARELAAALH